jgi:hypothetical protein
LEALPIWFSLFPRIYQVSSLEKDLEKLNPSKMQDADNNNEQEMQKVGGLPNKKNLEQKMKIAEL